MVSQDMCPIPGTLTHSSLLALIVSWYLYHQKEEGRMYKPILVMVSWYLNHAIMQWCIMQWCIYRVFLWYGVFRRVCGVDILVWW